MVLSISLIAEHLRIRNGRMAVHLHNDQHYSDVMLYGEGSPMRPEVLYLSRGIPKNLPEGYGRSGLVCMAAPEQYPDCLPDIQRLRCNTLLIGTDMDFGALFNEISSVLIHIREQMDIFRTAVYTQQSLQMLTEMIFDILGNPAYIVDSSFKVLAIDNKHNTREVSAAWKRLEDEGYLPFDLVTNLINSGELRAMESVCRADIVYSKYFYVPFINYNLRHKGRVRGHIYIAGIVRHIRPGDLELADYLGNYIQEALIRDHSFQNQRGDYYEHFMRDMLSGKLVDRQNIRQQMAFLGIQPDDYHTICVLHTSSEHGLSDDRIASQLERCCGATPVFYNDKIVGLFSHRTKPEPKLLENALLAIHTELGCQVGVSDTFRGFYDFNTYYIQAEWALTDGHQSQGAIRHYRDHQTSHILHGFARQSKWRSAIPPQLEMLNQYDTENDASLMETLFVYLQNERSLQETARKLFIHRNTLAYRVSKIVELCGFDLDDASERQRLLLSMQLMRLFQQ